MMLTILLQCVLLLMQHEIRTITMLYMELKLLHKSPDHTDDTVGDPVLGG